MSSVPHSTCGGNQNNRAKSELIAQLLALMLNPGATEPEAQNAAAKAIVIARKEGVDIHAVVPHLGGQSLGMTTDLAEFANTPCPLPKHRGLTMKEILRIDPDYLVWIVREFKDSPIFRRRVADLLRHAGLWHD